MTIDAETLATTDLLGLLMSEVEICCTQRRIRRATLATLLVNDGKFFDRIDDGGSMTIKTYQRILTWLLAHRQHAA